MDIDSDLDIGIQVVGWILKGEGRRDNNGEQSRDANKSQIEILLKVLKRVVFEFKSTTDGNEVIVPLYHFWNEF